MLLGSLRTHVILGIFLQLEERKEKHSSLPPSIPPSLPFSFFLQEFIVYLLCAKLDNIPVERTYQGVLHLGGEAANKCHTE